VDVVTQPWLTRDLGEVGVAARDHTLLTNCLNCGRIVCEQEGPGACLTCGSDLFAKDQEVRLAKQLAKQHRAKPAVSASPSASASGVANAATAMAQHALPSRAPDGPASPHELQLYADVMAKADALRQRLLEYDRTSARRTTVLGTRACVRECVNA
jgi:activating signal cointegrator 1